MVETASCKPEKTHPLAIENFHNIDNPYWLSSWSENYYNINKNGDITVNPHQNHISVNLHELVQSLVKRGIEAPILFRFDGIIKDRINHIYSAFKQAIDEHQYKNSYQLAYPIKVNQQNHVVDVILKEAQQNHISIEVGSKPELLAVLTIPTKENIFLLCNGYKDAQYIELALLSRKLGKRTIIVIEQYYELKLVLQTAKRLEIEPEIGLRIKPNSKGCGKWASSSGDLAKFGLNIPEINLAIKELKKLNKDHYLKLMHFHIGSQITSIVHFKKALREAARMYAEIKKLCPNTYIFDVGGGLAIDYNGSKTTSDCSMNYNIYQYARDVVYGIDSICREENIDPPMIISESGRSITAHSSILVTEVIDVSSSLDSTNKLLFPPSKLEILKDLYDISLNINSSNCMEALHDAFDLKENAIAKFMQGKLSLEERAYTEIVYKHITSKVLIQGKKLKFTPKEFEELENKNLDIYFCNFSLFQSLPDAWAIQQLFPVMPIHRLKSIPTRKATIVDITCDSDGTINNFVNPKNKTTNWIPLHEMNENPYYLGIFLVGAYQETLGNLHNLFGDTNAVHVDVDKEGNWEIKNQIEGDSIGEVLSYVQYNTSTIMEQLRCAIEKALKNNQLSLENAIMLKNHFKQALESYTYLVKKKI